MSNSSPSLEPVQQEETHEPVVVCQGSLSLNQETLNPSDLSLPKSDPTNTPPRQPDLDLEDNGPDEEEADDEDGREIDEGQEQETPAISSGTAFHLDPPITAPHVAVRDVTLTSPYKGQHIRLAASKRKKGKGKGRPNIRKQQAIEQKLQTLMAKLNPIPFIPNKILDFAKHEELLKKLNLWDFVHIDFDRNIRVDLIAQLIATYETKACVSYVNNCRITVSRAELARAFKLPVKKKGKAGGVEVELEQEPLSDDSVGFITEFVSDWVLLHEDDAWLMPNEVSVWLKLIKDGQPEKVDWASMFWFMVKKELEQGGLLRECYYASHLQHLMRCQRTDLFLSIKSEGADAAEEYQEVNKGDDIKNSREEGCLMDGPSTELKLGQDDDQEEGLKDIEVMDVENCQDIEGEDEDEEIEEEQGRWRLQERNKVVEHFMQRCTARNVEEFKRFEEKKEEEEEIEEEDKDADGNTFNVFPNDDALQEDRFTGNLLQAVEGNQMDLQMDMPHINSTSSDFNNSGKRVIDHDDHHISHRANGSLKKLRTNDTWDHKPLDFGMCMEQIQHVTERARMLYKEKEQMLQQSYMTQRLLLTELQKRDAVVERLHKMRVEEIQKKDGEIYRFERELYLMGSVLEGYRKALTETKRAFAEYRGKAQLLEESTYKDAGPGGLMLTAAEIEKLRNKRDEESKTNGLIIEQKVKEFEDDCAGRFDKYVEKCYIFELRLTGLEAAVNELIELYKKRKTKQPEEAVPEVFEAQSEEVVDAEESLLITQTGGEVSEVEEKVIETEESVSIAQTEEKVSEVEEKVVEAEQSVPTAQTKEKVSEVKEYQPNA